MRGNVNEISVSPQVIGWMLDHDWAHVSGLRGLRVCPTRRAYSHAYDTRRTLTVSDDHERCKRRRHTPEEIERRRAVWILTATHHMAVYLHCADHLVSPYRFERVNAITGMVEHEHKFWMSVRELQRWCDRGERSQPDFTSCFLDLHVAKIEST